MKPQTPQWSQYVCSYCGLHGQGLLAALTFSGYGTMKQWHFCIWDSAQTRKPNNSLQFYLCPQWQHVSSRTIAADLNLESDLQWIWNIVQTPESATSNFSPRGGGWNVGLQVYISACTRGEKKHSSCGKMQTVQLITLKDRKRNNKCWCCGS